MHIFKTANHRKPQAVVDNIKAMYAQSLSLPASGFTLIELIVIIVVVSVAAVGLMRVFITSVARSADPMQRMQAVAIAQGYLEEALLKAQQDPDGVETNSCEEGVGANRQNYDDVLDYSAPCVNDVGARDQFGTAVPELAIYTVTMTVNPVVIVGVTMQQVTVTVNYAGQPAVNLVGWR